MANAENIVERYLCNRIVQLGGECFKWTGTVGCTDRIVIMPDGVVWFVEVKTKDGKLSSGQKRFIKRLNGLTANATTVYGVSGVSDWINEHIIKL